MDIANQAVSILLVVVGPIGVVLGLVALRTGWLPPWLRTRENPRAFGWSQLLAGAGCIVVFLVLRPGEGYWDVGLGFLAGALMLGSVAAQLGRRRT